MLKYAKSTRYIAAKILSSYFCVVCLLLSLGSASAANKPFEGAVRGGWIASDIFGKSCFHDGSCPICPRVPPGVDEEDFSESSICKDARLGPQRLLKRRLLKICPSFQCNSEELRFTLLGMGFIEDKVHSPRIMMFVPSVMPRCSFESGVIWDVENGMTKNVSTFAKPSTCF